MKIQKKYIIVIILGLIILVTTWGDKFNYKKEHGFWDSSFEYFNNYEEIKEKYIKNNNYGIYRYSLKNVAEEVNDTEFLRFMLEKERNFELSEIEYLESLLSLYIFEKKYEEAKELAYSLKDDKKYYNVYRSNDFIYERLIDIYFDENDREAMVSLYEEIRGLEKYNILDFSKESLKKLINLIDDDIVTEEILNNYIESINRAKEIDILDLVFILEVSGYDSKEMNSIIDIGEKINSEESNKEWKIDKFIKLYDLFKDEEYVYLDNDLLITEKENKYIIRYYNDKSINFVSEEIVDKPLKYKNYYYIYFVLENSRSNKILLQYEDKAIVKEEINGKSISIDIDDDVIVGKNSISSDALDISIDIRGEIGEKNIELDNYIAYEIIKFKDGEKTTDVILKEYRILETGYLEFVNMKKIISY